MRVRSAIISLHVWLGITLGFFWALQGLTGAVLVFNRDIQRWSLHESEYPRVLKLDEIFRRASAHAGAPVQRIETFGPSRTLFLAYYNDRQDHPVALVVDGRSGAVLDRRDPEAMLPHGGSSWSWLLRLHEALLLGDRGSILVGSSGALLLSTLIAAGYLGWPMRRRWRAVFKARAWRTTSQRLFGWHRMLGLLVVAPMIIVAVCGIYLAFAQVLRPVLIAQAGYRPAFKAHPVKALPSPMIPAQQALDTALDRFPDALLQRAVLPTKKSPAYIFRLLQPGEPRRWAGTTTVAVDPASGRILDSYDPLRGPAINTLTDDLYPIHTGELAGLLGRVLVMLAGLALPVLYVTGLWAWFRRRSLQKKPSPRAALTPGKPSTAGV